MFFGMVLLYLVSSCKKATYHSIFTFINPKNEGSRSFPQQNATEAISTEIDFVQVKFSCLP